MYIVFCHCIQYKTNLPKDLTKTWMALLCADRYPGTHTIVEAHAGFGPVPETFESITDFVYLVFSKPMLVECTICSALFRHNHNGEFCFINFEVSWYVYLRIRKFCGEFQHLPQPMNFQRDALITFITDNFRRSHKRTTQRKPLVLMPLFKCFVSSKLFSSPKMMSSIIKTISASALEAQRTHIWHLICTTYLCAS